ncbi:ski-like protein [Engraulis encrasicolus]|uniref:ski-like protein n=1 Tax=Engraulis encrasicolus TaxID=184585 RepID=UPI002FD23FD0
MNLCLTMASTQTSLKTHIKGLTSFKGNMKRLYRERLDYAPIKKRVMAEINLKRRSQETVTGPGAAKVKNEHVDAELLRAEMDQIAQGQDVHGIGVAKALDLSPGLKHTLAQFTLSSQSSLGGPAAFSAKSAHEPGNTAAAVAAAAAAAAAGAPMAHLNPMPSPPALGSGPLLVPCDSSTELTHSLLEGESISCFAVGGEKRLCLPQVLNSVLRDFSLQQINAVCDELYVYCSRCDAEQLHILKVLGILPFNAPSCGLITLTDAQRLCNALLRPGTALPPELGAKLSAQGLLKESRDAFQVEHYCLGKCQGLFVPQFYVAPGAPCIQCVECQLLFSPQNFVMHSHRSSDKRTCHWGFDSAKWPCYLLLARKYLGSTDEPRLKQQLEAMKEKFHYQHKLQLDKAVDEDPQMVKANANNSHCSTNGKLSDNESTRKGKGHAGTVFNHLFPDIKEEPGHDTAIHPSYYLYPYDKMLPPNVSLRKETEVNQEVLGALLKQHYGRGRQDTPPMDLHSSPSAVAPSDQAESQCTAAERQAPPAAEEVALATGGENAHAPATVAVAAAAEEKDGSISTTVAEDDKERIVLEIVQMYSRQQERLHATLHKQLQLEMELEALRGGSAARLRELSVERSELQTELEAVHTEHAQRLGEVRQEQRQLEARLEQLRQQTCACEPSTHKQQEQHYTQQLSKLRVRLERAEAERAELAEELTREREARERLQLTITQLQQQMARTSTLASSNANTITSSPSHSHTPPPSNTPTPTQASPSSPSLVPEV